MITLIYFLRRQDPAGYLSETRAICASGSHSFIHLQALVRISVRNFSQKFPEFEDIFYFRPMIAA